jgi:cysteine synthase
MKKITGNVLDLIGNTPMVKLNRIVPEGFADVYVKLEEYNLGGSIKSRIAMRMVIEAEKKGILRPGSGQTIIEPTGGNTGIGLAIMGAIHGYKTIFVIPDNYSKEKILILRTYGAEVALSDHRKGNNSHIEKVKEILKEHPEYIWLNQFINENNPIANYETTGQEIIDSLNRIDCFVAGVGTGGTISGIGKKIKEKFPDARIIGVQPEGCDLINGKSIPHKIEGLAVGIVPEVFDTKIVDNMLSISDEEAFEYIKLLARKEGLFLGVSSGANVCAAIKMAKELGKGKTVVTVSPDGGKNYIKSIGEFY